MRKKFNAQTELDFQPSNLELTNRYYAKYEAISSILNENPKILNLVHRNMKKALAESVTEGNGGAQFKYTSENVLRILISQIIEGMSLRQIVIRIDDSNFLRRFTRILNGPMMDFTTLDKLKNTIHSKTWRRVNEALAMYAADKKLISYNKLRLDTTAVETNIHWPTDSSLLWDVYRAIARNIEKARELDPEVVGPGRVHRRRAKRLMIKISRKAARKGKKTSASQLKPLYEDLIGRVEGILTWAESIAKSLGGTRNLRRYGSRAPVANIIIEDIEHTLPLGRRVVNQARLRVLEGVQVPNDEKLFSIFEPHTELLKRGKAGKDIEFGHMVQIGQVQEKFITNYDIFKKKPVEHRLLRPALDGHKKLFGQYPDELGADKGYYESMGALEELRKDVKMVSIAKKGKRTEEETERERDPAFRHTQRFRAGVEGSISFLKRVLGLLRCMNKGWEHYAATIGATVFAHNLLILARC